MRIAKRAGRLQPWPKPTCSGRRWARKDAELIKKELGKFAERAMALGHPRRLVDRPAAQIETFGRYGLNKSHSVAYSLLSYQDGVLKATTRRVHGGAAVVGDREHRQVVQVHQRRRGSWTWRCWRRTVNESGFKFTVVGRAPDPVSAWAPSGTSAGVPSRPSSLAAGRAVHHLAEFVERIDLRLCTSGCSSRSSWTRRVRRAGAATGSSSARALTASWAKRRAAAAGERGGTGVAVWDRRRRRRRRDGEDGDGKQGPEGGSVLSVRRRNPEIPPGPKPSALVKETEVWGSSSPASAGAVPPRGGAGSAHAPLPPWASGASTR